MSVTILVMAVPPSHNQLRRKYRHWAVYKKLKAQWMKDIHYGASNPNNRLAIAKLPEKRYVRILIQHKRLFDVDNAYASCKPILDAMVELGYLKDDSPDFLDLRVEQEKINAKQTKITISEAGA